MTDTTRREVTPIEGLFLRSPYAVVTAVARVRGELTPPLVADALAKVRRRHAALRTRIVEDDQGTPWLAADDTHPIEQHNVDRLSETQWVELFGDLLVQPFDFAARAPVRVALVRGSDVSELLLMCHHVLCDGMSLAYVLRDLLTHLGDPSREPVVLPPPRPITRDTMPAEIKVGWLTRRILARIGDKWQRDREPFDQQDYEAICDGYYSAYQHRIQPLELDRSETAALVARCKREGVTVNSALTAAFVGAQRTVLGDRPWLRKNVVAGSLRDRLTEPVADAMGFYASSVTVNHRYDPNREPWDNARRFHHKLQRLYTDKQWFKEHAVWTYLDTSMMEAFTFKKLGGMVSATSPRHDKLAAYGARKDVVHSVARRTKVDDPHRTYFGTAVTNLTRLPIPEDYGPLRLERMLLVPGGGWPHANFALVVGAVTCAGRLSLVLQHAEQVTDSSRLTRIRDEGRRLLGAD